MDSLSSVAEVRIIFVWPILDRAEFRSQLHPFAKMAYSVLSVIPKVHLFASLFGVKLLRYVYLDTRNSQNSMNVTKISQH